MLASRIADELIDPADIYPRNAWKFSGIGYADEDTAAFAIRKGHHFRGKGTHVTNILLELETAVLSFGCDGFQFGFFHYANRYDSFLLKVG